MGESFLIHMPVEPPPEIYPVRLPSVQMLKHRTIPTLPQTICSLPLPVSVPNTWKMAVALLTYIFLAWFCLSMKVNNTFGAALWVERVFALIIMLFIVASIFDYLHVRKLMPLCQHEKKATRIFGVVVLDILVVFGLIVVMAIVQSFCPNS